jgi:hypothetical protein
MRIGTDRLARIAAVFTFVSQLMDTPPPPDGRPRDGVEVLLTLAGEAEGPAVVLCALLLAIGERARIDVAGGAPFVSVGLELEDVRRLPPHARLIASRDRLYIPLDPRQSRTPLGFLPAPVREALRTS